MTDKEAMIDKLLNDINISVEGRKSELMSLSGGVRVMQEYADRHAEFLNKIKGELQGLVNENKLGVDVANYVATWVDKTSKSVNDFLVIVRTTHDIKTGELIALDKTAESLRGISAYEPPAAVAEEAQSVADVVELTPVNQEITEQVSESTPATPDETPPKRKRHVTKKMEETVNRLKRGRAKSKSKDPI